MTRMVTILTSTYTQILMTGGFDHDGNVNARLNQGWSPNSVTKMQAQVRLL